MEIGFERCRLGRHHDGEIRHEAEYRARFIEERPRRWKDRCFCFRPIGERGSGLLEIE
jgi:hypothetical protein